MGSVGKEEQFLLDLFSIIKERSKATLEESYTARLYADGLNAILDKIDEETNELIHAARFEKKERTVEEACDLIYHLFVLLSFCNIDINEVGKELLKRHHAHYIK